MPDEHGRSNRQSLVRRVVRGRSGTSRHTMTIWPNKAGAGNGARALSFHVERLGRAVPDLCRSIQSPIAPQQRRRLSWSAE